MSKQHAVSDTRRLLIVLMVLVASTLAGCATNSDQTETGAQEFEQETFALKHIEPTLAQNLLSELELGTAYVLAHHDVLAVRGTGEQLHQAAIVLDLIDVATPYTVVQLGPASEAQNLPSDRELADLLGDVVIGTFGAPPQPGKQARGIIDVHSDRLVAIVPAPWRQELVAWAKLDSKELEVIEGSSTPLSLTDRPQTTGRLERTTPASVGPLATQVVANDGRVQPRGRRVMIPDKSAPAVKDTPGPRTAANTVTVAPQASDVADPAREPIAEEPISRPVSLPGGDEVLQLDLPEKLEMIQLLDLVGEYLELDYMYDPGKLKGQIVTLKLHGKLRGRMRVSDLYSLLESTLKFKGFAMTRHEGNVVTIVPAAEALQINPDLIDGGERPIEAGNMVVTSVFDLRSMSTAAASALLQNMKLSLDVTPVEDSRTLIITCYAHQVDRIERLLSVVDRPGRPKEFRSRQLKYTMANSLTEKVKELTARLKGVAVTVVVGPTSSRQRDVPRPIGGPAQLGVRFTEATASAEADEVYLDADERTNRIMMIGDLEQLAIVEELVDALDVAHQDLRVLKVYDIRHVEAGEVMRKLQELEIVDGAVPSGPTNASSGRITTVEIVEGTVAEAAHLVELEATNSIAINATEEQHARIEAMLAYLDVQVRMESIPYEIYFLENQDPENLAQVLEKIVHETVQDKEGKLQKTLRDADDQIMIVPDKQTFSLIVYASRKNQDWISKLITALDRRRPQVLIDVTLVEIRKTDEFNYDLNLITSIPDLIETGGQTGSFMADATTTVVEKLLQPGMREQFADFQVGSGSGTGFYADKQVNVLLAAMQTENYGRILAKPKVLVNDNEKGMIKTTETTYVIKTSSIPVTSGTAGEQSSLIETAVDYEGYDAGITLEIMPHISTGSLLRLEVTLTRSDFGTITGERPPDQTSSDINTVVTVPDQSTIILGGMLRFNQSKSGSKVPILGDLPLMGRAFRSISSSDIQSKLYVFVRAEIIRPTDTFADAHQELIRVSERNREAFEKHEAEFQNHQDWPGIKPEPIEPKHVLEAR